MIKKVKDLAVGDLVETVAQSQCYVLLVSIDEYRDTYGFRMYLLKFLNNGYIQKFQRRVNDFETEFEVFPNA